MVFYSRTIRTRTIAWHALLMGSQSLNRGCLNAYYMGLSGLECKMGDKSELVTGWLPRLNSDHKVPYTVSLFPYQHFTRETFSSVAPFDASGSPIKACADDKKRVHRVSFRSEVSQNSADSAASAVDWRKPTAVGRIIEAKRLEPASKR